MSVHSIRRGSLAIIFWVGLILQATSSLSPQAFADQRLVQDRPSTGRYVETKRGFMVPYTVRIPGSEVRFRMEPVPAGQLVLRRSDGDRIVIKTAAFWIGKHEVTFEEYSEFAALYHIARRGYGDPNAGKRAVDQWQLPDAVSTPTTVYDVSYRFEYVSGPRSPAISMTQFAARQYTKWLSLVTGQSFRLPAEAEWEFACSAGKNKKYCYGNKASRLSEFAVFGQSDNFNGPPAVGSKQPNDWGIHDMHGSVSEWVLDGTHPKGLLRLAAGTHSVGDSIYWSDSFENHALKGGYWLSDAAGCATRARQLSDEEYWDQDPCIPFSQFWLAGDEMQNLGFRVMSPLDPEKAEIFRRYWDPDTPAHADDVQSKFTEGNGFAVRVDSEIMKELDGHRDYGVMTRPWLKRK